MLELGQVSNILRMGCYTICFTGPPTPERAWLAIAMALTLAGNFTLIGSVASLIVAQRARQRDVTIAFWPYFTVRAPLTVLSIRFGVVWLGWAGLGRIDHQTQAARPSYSLVPRCAASGKTRI